MKKIIGLLLVLSLIYIATPSYIFAARYKQKSESPTVTGFFWGFSAIGGVCFPADPDRNAGRSGTYWSSLDNFAGFGGQILVDMYYYFKPFIALNWGLGFGSYQSLWKTAPGHNEGFGQPEVLNYRGFNIMPRLGVTNLWGNLFFLSAGLLIAPTVYNTYAYTGTASTHIFKPNDVPWGVYANLGFMIKTNSKIRVPIGFEVMLLDRYCWDYNGYRIIMWSFNAFVGVQF
jgi:hypothetical protein